MYGDNQNLIQRGIGLFFVLILGTFSVVSLVKIHKLEESLSALTGTETVLPVQDGKTLEEKAPVVREEDGELFNRALDLWEGNEKEKEIARGIGDELQKQDWDFLGELGLALSQSSSLYSLTLNRSPDRGEGPLFSLDYRSGEWNLKAPGGETLSFGRVNNRVEKFIAEQTESYGRQLEEKEKSLTLLEDLMNEGELRTLAARKLCRLVEVREGEQLSGVSAVTRKDGRTVVEALWNGTSLILDGGEIPAEQFDAAFRDSLSRADTRSDEEILVSRGLDRIRRLFGDKTFSSRLEKMGLYPQYLEREDADFVYLDLLDEAGKRQASFAVKKYTGRLHILDSEGISLASLDSLRKGQDTLPDNLADLDTAYEDGKSFNVLLVGYHNQGTDTMILAHVNRESERISLISIPRDLWWKGHKLNYYFFGTGREEFLDVMTDVTGLKTDFYLSVDMYAFIDVINALGGIDVTLEGEVRDPTYKVIRENGSAGTLYYPPGTYHLNGVEALRLARSRHGSSDFERSLLQQKILSALRKRAGELSLKDIGLFRSFLTIAAEQSETNMSLPFMVGQFLNMKDYDWDGGHNLNDETLLYNTYSEYLELSSAELSAARERDDFERGQWILLPLGEDWNLIKTRVRKIIQG